MNWELILLIVVVVLGSLSAWAGFKKLINSMRDLMVTVADAIADDNIDNAEIIQILKDAKGVAKSFMEIVKLFNK